MHRTRDGYAEMAVLLHRSNAYVLVNATNTELSIDMAHVTSPTRSILAHTLSSFGQFFTNFFDQLAHAAEAQAQGDARLVRVRALQAKTDAELAELGLQRDEIVRHVFRDYYYL
ncbi:MAG: hypothetical protein ACSHWZ_16475 [Sulfitobacter sp.]